MTCEKAIEILRLSATLQKGRTQKKKPSDGWREERTTESWRTNKSMTDDHHLHNGVMESVNETCADLST